ncbi:hypothetical protein EDD11_003130 [Mortierella claussenii]|nr:hypothetical protein EDD11_003130 [Mortierella claussenii]
MGHSGTMKVYRMQESGDIGVRDPLIAVSGFTPRKSNVWTSDVVGDKVVISMDQQIYHLDGWKSGPMVGHYLWTGSDVFSVLIDPPDRSNLVYAGCRNGSVRVFDINQPGLFSTAKELNKKKKTASLWTGIGHKESSVQCMRRVADHYLVTAATNGEISMWDTRFIAASTGYLSSSGSGSGTYATPVLEIRRPILHYSSKAQFDINNHETLLASGNIEGQLSLWSLATGNRVRDLDVGGRVDCLKFSTDQQGVWAAVGDQVQHWSLALVDI